MKALTTNLLTAIVAVLCLCTTSPAQAAAPPAGSTIIAVSTKNYSPLCEIALTNSEANPYVFTGELPEMTGYSELVFKYGETSYGLDAYTQYTEFPESFEMTKGKSGKLRYENGTTINGPITIVATLSEDENTLSVKLLRATPVSITVNGTENLLCEDINKVDEAARVWSYATPVSVHEGETATVALKVGDKTFGYAVPEGGTDEFAFDAENRAEQIKSAALTQGADPLTINTEGTYTLAIKIITNADQTTSYILEVTKAGTDKELTFGQDNYFAYNQTGQKWVGTADLTSNQELPALVLTDYTTTPQSVKTYWFAQNINDSLGDPGQPKTVALTTEEPAKKAKCITEGIYKFDVVIAADGTAKAQYHNTTVPVEIKDLYVCVYDKHWAPDQWGNWNYGYKNTGDTFSCDYKVTYKLPDGSYAVALYLNEGQAFYLMNNGVEYRPAEADVDANFGTAEAMTTFTFSPSTDTKLRKHVSYVAGYRMLIIKPNKSNLDVKGYKMDIDNDNRMAVVKSLAAPEEHGHMADVIIKFTIPEGHTAEEGYIQGYRKMALNPSGTHALYNLNLKAGQTFQIWRGRAIKDEAGNVTGIEDLGRVQYGCKESPAEGESSVTIVDGDISTLHAEHESGYKTNTYSVINDGEFNFVCFYTTGQKQLTVSRKVKQDRGITIAVYDENGNQYGDLVDMQYKNVNRRNLMTVQVPKGGSVQFGFMVGKSFQQNGEIENKGEFTPFEFYNLGISNKVGYNTPAEEDMKQDIFYADNADYKADETKCWYRFRIRLREDGKYCLSYQPIPMPETTWLSVTDGSVTTWYSADEDKNNPGHYVFKNVTLNKDCTYYFVNQQGATFHNGTQEQIEEATKNGLIWYCGHTSSGSGNPVMPGRNINMFSHLNVGTDYQDAKYEFYAFTYSGTHNLSNIEIDMDIASMSHRYGYDYEGQDFRFVGRCARAQIDGDVEDWGENSEKYRMEYHPTTGYYTCFLDYLWGDWFIYYYENGSMDTSNDFYAFNLNNVVHEFDKPYYLSNGHERYVSDLKTKTPTGTAANTPIKAGEDGKIPGGTYKDRYMIALAPGAVGIIQSENFQREWVHTPVYKDVTIVFDPANNVLWLDSGHVKGKPDIEDPYGELYLIFTNVDAATWDAARREELANPDASKNKGTYWVKLTRDENQLGHYTAKGIHFPARNLNDTESSSHSSYFFSNRIGATLAETICFSNSYHAMEGEPSETDLYGPVFTKLNYNDAGYGGLGSFVTDQKPLDLVDITKTAYAQQVFVRLWDNYEDAPYENCEVPKEEAQSYTAAPRRADENNADTSTDTSTESGTDTSTDVETNIDIKPVENSTAVDGNFPVLRTFASEPYTYDVDVHLGRKLFTLETSPKNIVTSVEILPSEDGEEARPAAVVRTAAGHISVTGAQSVSIYTITGSCLLYNAPGAELDVPHGLYIVVADGHATKHML